MKLLLQIFTLNIFLDPYQTIVLSSTILASVVYVVPVVVYGYCSFQNKCTELPFQNDALVAHNNNSLK